jgi:hypothetical protein
MSVLATGFTLLAMLAPGTGHDPVADHDYEARHKGCNTRRCDHRLDIRVHHVVRARKWRAVLPYNEKLERMAMCESSGHWHIATGNGYSGGLQFDLQTWRSVGGRGWPHHNSPLEQKYRAVLLIKRRGYQPWPVCGSA